MESKLDVVHYDESLVIRIQELFIKKIVPANFLLVVHKHDLNVLTNRDIIRLRKKLDHDPDEDVNVDLLNLLIRYDGWFECILKVLNDPEIKQGHLVKLFEDLKGQHDLKWNCEHPKNDEISTVTVVTEPIVSQATDNATNEGHAATDLESMENNGSLDESVVDRSMCSDPVEGFKNLSISKSKEWSMTDGKGQCFVCNIELTSEQHKNQHLEGKNHKKKLERNSLDGIDKTPAEVDETPDEAEQKDPKFCHVCQLLLTSPEHAKQHYDGIKHRKKADALKKNITVSREVSFSEGSVSMDDDEDGNASERNDPKFCSACNLALTSPEHAKQHYDGKHHKKKIDALKIMPALDSTAQPALGDNEIYSLDASGKGCCKVCNVVFTSKQNAQEHLKGKNHEKKVGSK